MKDRIGTIGKIWKIAPLALLTLMLFSTIAFAKVDVQISEPDDGVKFVVKNVGERPTYVLNSLAILDDKGNKLYTSQELSSAELLKIDPGKSFTFEWDRVDVPEGVYTGKIYEENNKRNLRAISVNFLKLANQGKPKLFTDKKIYKFGENVDVIFRNMGLGTVYVNVNNWEITNPDTGEVVTTLSKECTFGYGGCVDSFEPLRFMKSIEQTWDQKDSSGNQVAPGKYMVTAEYSNSDPSSGSEIKTISTKKFFIKSPKKIKD